MIYYLVTAYNRLLNKSRTYMCYEVKGTKNVLKMKLLVGLWEELDLTIYTITIMTIERVLVND